LSVCHVQSTPAGLLSPDRYGAAAWPLVCEKQRLPRKVFRRSVAWLSDSLSTLRRGGYPAPTQDSLPAAGQALLDGLFTRKVPTEGFRGFRYISSSFPKLCLAQSHRPAKRTAHYWRGADGALTCVWPAGSGIAQLQLGENLGKTLVHVDPTRPHCQRTPISRKLLLN
jgi:hypothetical protein